MPLLLGAMLLAGCAASAPAAPEATVDVDVVIELGDIHFDPDRIVVDAGRTVVAELHNVGGIVHDLVFEDGRGSDMIEPGRRAALELGPFDASTVGWCSVPGHRDAGMELEVVVTND